MEGGRRGWAPSSRAVGRGRCRAGQWEIQGHSCQGATDERVRLSPQPSLFNSPSHVPAGTQPVQWEPSVAPLWAGISRLRRTWDSDLEAGSGDSCSPLQRAVGLCRQVSLSVSSCPPLWGSPGGGEGRGRGGGHLALESPSPSLSGFLVGGLCGLPLLTIFPTHTPAQESVSVGREGPGLTAAQGWVGMVGPGQAQPAFS